MKGVCITKGVVGMWWEHCGSIVGVPLSTYAEAIRANTNNINSAKPVSQLSPDTDC